MFNPQPEKNEIPLYANTLPLIRIRSKADVVYAKTCAQKRELINTRKRGDRFVTVWPGQWSSDTFDVSPEFVLRRIQPAV